MEGDQSTWVAELDLMDKKKPTRLSLQLIVKRHLPPDAASWEYEEIISALNKVTHVRMDRENIREIDNFELLGSNVTNVYLQRNCIEKIENLNCLTNLVFLMLAGNKIKTVENLTCMSKLALLDVSDNCIETYDVDEFPQSLVILNLKGNPCTGLPDHRGGIIQELPCLRQLNEKDITKEERLEAGYSVSSDEEEEDALDDSDAGQEITPEEPQGSYQDQDAQLADYGSLKYMANEILERSQKRLEDSLDMHKQHSEDLMKMRIKYRLPPRSHRAEEQAALDG